MQINGTTIPTYLVIPILIFTFWLGGLSMSHQSLADDQKEHQEKRAHDDAVEDITSMKSDLKHNKEAIDKLDKKLGELEEKIDNNQKELLEALREE